MNRQDIKHTIVTQKTKIIVIALSVLYLLILYLLAGLRLEHWLIIGFYNLCFFCNFHTRKFILAFTVFVIYGILYDVMKFYPNYLVNPVDISSLYHFEQKVFGFVINNQLLTPNEFFGKYHNTFLDILTGLFYVNWLPVPFAFALWLYFHNKQQFLKFSLTFFLVNLIGFCIYYIHPATPPWYVSLYGFDLHLNVPSNTASLARFDNFFHIPLFKSIYSRNSNIFAAIPSLHCAYAVVVFYYAVKSRMNWIKWLLGIFMVGIWFSAVYSGHHYVTDVSLGIICACAGILIFQKILLNVKTFQKWINNYTLLIS